MKREFYAVIQQDEDGVFVGVSGNRKDTRFGNGGSLGNWRKT